MRAKEHLPSRDVIRLAASLIACGCLLAGCSQDYVSFDDNYVPVVAEERYPIRVLDEPVKMTLVASRPHLSEEQIIDVIGFARQAQASNAGSIAVLYASGNRNGPKAAAQAAELIARQGIPRGLVTTSAYEGHTANLTLSYYRKVARTKPCGDWSENMAGNQYNEPYPNFGCAIQNNFAAMVANPEDFEQFRTATPAQGQSRSAILRKYNSGEWSQKKQELPDTTSTFQP